MQHEFTQLPTPTLRLGRWHVDVMSLVVLSLIAINCILLRTIYPFAAEIIAIISVGVWWWWYYRQKIQKRHIDFARHVMDAMGQGLTVTNAREEFEYVNHAFAAMLGYTPRDLIGLSPQTITHPDDLRELSGGVENRQHGTTSSYEVRLRQANGSYTFALITGVPRMESDKFIGTIAVVTNLNERKQLEQSIRTARDEALETERLKSEFLATMSHEIRTPMNGILGMSELLLETPLTPEQREFANIVQSEANALLTIINDILDFTKIEAGKMLLESTELVVEDILIRIVESMRPLVKGRELSISSVITPEVPFTVKGDPVRLRQILLNLVGNALKFTPEGEITISVSQRSMVDDQILLRFEVTDTGIGLSEAARKRLFQPFTQADRSTTRKYGGTGLGLVICKRLAELMGGEIGVESVEGQGSTFWFTARFETVTTQPVSGTQPLSTQPRQRKLHTAPLANLDTRPLILVVGDIVDTEPALRFVEQAGCRMETASSGDVALDMLAAVPERYAFLIIDCEVLDVDNCRVVRRLREREIHKPNFHLPVVTITPSAQPSDHTHYYDAGVDAVLSKPLHAEQVQRLVKEFTVIQWH